MYLPPERPIKAIETMEFKMATISVSGRRSGLMVSELDSGSSGPGFKPWPRTLCCVLGQDT